MRGSSAGGSENDACSAFLTFLKIGAFTFGGGYAMLPLIQAEVVRHGWMSLEELVNFVAVSESTPGPFAINISTYVGTSTAGIPGALCATLGVSLPSIIVILIVARVYDKFRRSRIVEGCLGGLRPATVGLIAAAAVSVGAEVFFPGGFSLQCFTSPELYVSLAIFALALCLTLRRVHPIAPDTDIRSRRDSRRISARPASLSGGIDLLKIIKNPNVGCCPGIRILFAVLYFYSSYSLFNFG